jgi:hypothetical protein
MDVLIDFLLCHSPKFGSFKQQQNEELHADLNSYEWHLLPQAKETAGDSSMRLQA